MGSNDDAHKLFVAGLPQSVTEEVLRDLFSGAGINVADVSIPRDRMTGRPRGFAFVRVGGPDEVERALADLHGHMLAGASISVRRFNAEPPARGERPAGPGGGGERSYGGGGGGGGGERSFGGGPRGGDTSDRTLYVGNLPYDATQEEVETTLREAGAEGIVRVHLPLDADGRRRGFGFVTLASADATKAAVDQLRGVALRGRPLVVNAALPKSSQGGAPRGERSFGGPSAGPPGASAGGPPAGRFGPPAKPGAKADYGKRKKGEGEGGGRARASKRSNEDQWRNYDDE